MKQFAITILAISLLGIGYVFYEQWFKTSNETLWSFVPESAIAVFENENLLDTWESLQSTETWNNLSNVHSFGLIGDRLNSLDTVMGGNGALAKITNNNRLLTSLHITSEHQFDFLFQIEIDDIESHAGVWQALDKIQEMGFRSQSRTYQGHTLTEITDGESAFTYIFYQNFFIGSFTPFLVEDVIRTIDTKGSTSFEAQHRSLFSLVKLQNDHGNLYVNSSRIGDLVGVFVDELQYAPEVLNDLLKSTFLDVSFDDKNISFNGFSTQSNIPNFLNTFHENPASTLRLSNLIPQRTSTYHHISFNDAVKWNSSLQEFWSNSQPDIVALRKQLQEKNDVDVSQYFKWIHDQIGFAVLESNNHDAPPQLLFVPTKDPTEAFKDLNQLVSRTLNAGDSIYKETYDNIEIAQITVSDFPKALFGNLFSGFESTYFTFLDEFIIMSNNAEEIKNWYDSYTSDNTWGKSLKTIQFLDATLKEANYTLYIKTDRSWNSIKSHLSPKWTRFMDENAGVFRRFEMGAFQFSYIDSKFYTNIVLQQPESGPNAGVNYNTKQAIDFATPIVTTPFIVRNHNTRDFEVLLQDSLNNLYLIGSEGEVLWNDSIGHRINSEVFQIDFYKNGKLQYLFASSEHLFVVDRNGDSVPPYPKEINYGDEKIEFLSLVDYDKSKNYRFMVSTNGGNIYLYDKNGKNLDGWKPRELGSRLSASAFHRRIRSRDRMIAVEKRGMVNVISRTGLMSGGFPIDLKSDTQGAPYISVGSDFENSSLTTITQSGEIVSINFNGEIIKRQQLYKPTPDTEFSTLIDVMGQSYLFVRKSANRLAIMDSNGEILFEKDYLSSNNLSWQYYNYGGNKEIIIVLDKDQEFAYLYSKNGQLINYQPVEASQPVGLLYFTTEDNFRLYKVYGNQFSVLEFSY